MKNKNIKINFFYITLLLTLSTLLLSACSTSSSTPTPTKETPNYRNYLYTGMSSFCATRDEVIDCANDIQTAIDNFEYEKITVPFEHNRDAFYLGMAIYCTDYTSIPYETCTKTVDQAMSNKYFEQVNPVPEWPLSKSTPNHNQ